MINGDFKKIKHDDMYNFMVRILEKYGVPTDEANIVAETLTIANLRGVDSHGIMRLHVYLKRLKAGSTRRVTKISVMRETASTAVVDGHHSFGQVVGCKSMELAISKAQVSGIGAVGVRNSEHYGAAAFYAMLALEKNMIGISISNATPLMVPTGGIEPLLGNNPIAIAVPANKKFPIVLDMSTSVVAMGKILLAYQRGNKIPIGWGRDKHGALTDNPVSIIRGGTLFPIGDYKGYGLAVVFDVLCGVLTGSGFTTGVHSVYKEIDKYNRCGHFMMAININDFIPISEFTRKIDRMIKQIKESPRAKEDTGIYLPGEIEFLTEKQRMRDGIPVEKSLISELNKLAEGLNIEFIRCMD